MAARVNLVILKRRNRNLTKKNGKHETRNSILNHTHYQESLSLTSVVSKLVLKAILTSTVCVRLYVEKGS
jgi:hypothetical protein